MSEPVTLSDELVDDARLTAELAKRTVDAQVELWARLGRDIEPFLRNRSATQGTPISECLAMVGTDEGRERLAQYLETRPYPHYQVVDDRPGLLVRIEQDGTRTIGRFVDREFQAVE